MFPTTSDFWHLENIIYDIVLGLLGIFQERDCAPRLFRKCRNTVVYVSLQGLSSISDKRDFRMKTLPRSVALYDTGDWKALFDMLLALGSVSSEPPLEDAATKPHGSRLA